jgi:hypothetical protein
LRANAIRGIITFALGGLILIFGLGFVHLFFVSSPSSIGGLMNGLLLTFIGFLFIGMGLWGIIQDALGSNQNPSK